MGALSRVKRLRYKNFSPVFWNPSETGDESQKDFFRKLISDENHIVIVADEGEGLSGFIIGSIKEAPPVYDPGGKVCLIDDYVVTSSEQWATVGEALKEGLEKACKLKGVTISVTVCGAKDQPKREFIRSRGEQVASEWYINVIK